MSPSQAVIAKLTALFEKKGYVTESEIFDACETHDLDLSQIDFVSNQLLDKGVLIGDAPLTEHSDAPDASYDYTQTDYDKIYRYFRKHYPGMNHVIKMIKRITPPQKGEMEQLLQQTRSGNLFTREILIHKNLRTALKMAYSYRTKTSIPLDDIFQVAVIGIMKAIESYDPYSHSYFTSYCGTWMMQNVDRYICDRETIIRIPVHAYEKIQMIRQWREDYEGSTLIEKIQSEFAVDSSEAQKLVSYSEFDHIQSINLLLSRKNQSQLIDDFSVEEMVDERIANETIRQALSLLSPKERKVIILRYGLIDNRIWTLEEVGSVLQITRERVRQIELKTLRKLKSAPQFRHLYLLYEEM